MVFVLRHNIHFLVKKLWVSIVGGNCGGETIYLYIIHPTSHPWQFTQLFGDNYVKKANHSCNCRSNRKFSLSSSPKLLGWDWLRPLVLREHAPKAQILIAYQHYGHNRTQYWLSWHSHSYCDSKVCISAVTNGLDIHHHHHHHHENEDDKMGDNGGEIGRSDNRRDDQVKLKLKCTKASMGWTHPRYHHMIIIFIRLSSSSNDCERLSSSYDYHHKIIIIIMIWCI